MSTKHLNGYIPGGVWQRVVLASDHDAAIQEKNDALAAAWNANAELRAENERLRKAASRVQKWRSSAGAYCNGDHKTIAEIASDFDALAAALKETP